MKIIDLGKLFGSPFEVDNKINSKIILLKRFKKHSQGQKVITIENKNNDFKINNGTSKDSFDEFWILRKSLMKDKISNGSLQVFNNCEMKIKELGKLTHNISEVNSTDPRFIALWNYNENIVINLYFKTTLIFSGNFNEYKQEFNFINIRSQEFYRKFLYPFPTKKSPAIKGFGPIAFKKYLSNIDQKFEELFDDNNFEKNNNINELVRRIA